MRLSSSSQSKSRAAQNYLHTHPQARRQLEQRVHMSGGSSLLWCAFLLTRENSRRAWKRVCAAGNSRHSNAESWCMQPGVFANPFALSAPFVGKLRVIELLCKLREFKPFIKSARRQRIRTLAFRVDLACYSRRSGTLSWWHTKRKSICWRHVCMCAGCWFSLVLPGVCVGLGRCHINHLGMIAELHSCHTLIRVVWAPIFQFLSKVFIYTLK